MIAEDQKTTRILKVIRDATGHTRLLLHAYAGIVNQVYALIEEAKDDACRGAIALCGLQTLLGERVSCRDGKTHFGTGRNQNCLGVGTQPPPYFFI